MQGSNAELTAEKYFISSGWQVERRRWKTPFAEIDLLLEKGGVRLIVEVKSVGPRSEDFLETRVGPRQWQRFLRARLWIEEAFDCEVRALVALVRDLRVTLVEVDEE